MTTNNDEALALEFNNVSKIYRTYLTPQHRLLELISGGRKSYARETRALDDISFSLSKGGRLGIVGQNGSGKSTLLKVLAGVLTPTSGTVNVTGRISALLELGAGFHPELSGAENIRQFCMLHGMHKDEIDEALPKIISFSELREAISHPVKTYSSGMSVRLGFACAVYVKPDILIVDEALSVGDTYFQNKCLHKIKSLLDEGITFIYVTHAADSIRSLCDQGIWMEGGKIKLSGSSNQVGAAYQAETFRRMVHAGLGAEEQNANSVAASRQEQSTSINYARHQLFEERVEPLRTGSGEARIKDITLVGPDGADVDRIDFNARCHVRVFYRLERTLVEKCALTLGVTDSSGRQIFHFNSASKEIYVATHASHSLHVIEFEFDNPLCPGEYGFIAGIGLLADHPQNNGQSLIEELIDYCVGGMRFSVDFPSAGSSHDLWGLVHVPFSASEAVLD